MAILDNQAVLGSVLPSVHFKKVILESGGDINPLEKDNPHIQDKDIWDENKWLEMQNENQNADGINFPPKMTTWDSTQPLDDESGKMSSTISLVLKDVYDPHSDNTMWMFDELFLNHVRLVIIQMGAHEAAADPDAVTFKKKLEEWFKLYNKTGINIKYQVAETGAFHQTTGVYAGYFTSEIYPDLCDGPFDIPCSGPGLSFGQGSNIKDYIIRSWPLREVIEQGIPQYVELAAMTAFPGSGGGGAVDPAFQKKLLDTILTNENTTAPLGEATPISTDDLPSGQKIINIPFQTTFPVERENPHGLAYMAFTWFSPISAAWPYFPEGDNPDNPYYDTPLADFPIPVGLDGETDVSLFADVVRSPGNVKHIIKNKLVNKTDTIFLLANGPSAGKQWYGNIKAVDQNTNVPLAVPPVENSDYVVGAAAAGANIGWYTYHPDLLAGFDVTNEEKLILLKQKDSIISDFRALSKAEKILIEFKNYQNDIASSKLLGSYNSNIVLPEKGVFSDAYLGLEHHSSIDSYNEEWHVANYFFTIDVRSILEKNSLFPWIYTIPQVPSPPLNSISMYTNALLQHAGASCRIKNFRIKRRAVQDKAFFDTATSDFVSTKDLWSPMPAEDPDPHTDGYILQYANNTAIISQGSVSHQKISPLFNSPIAGAESCADFSLSDSIGMELDFDESDGVSWAGRFSKASAPGSHLYMSQASSYPGLIHISGIDKRIPKTGKKRYQYGVEFKIKDGFVNTLRTFLGEGPTYAVEYDLQAAINELISGASLLTIKSNTLEHIKRYIDLSVVASNNSSSPVFPVVDSTTGLFTEAFGQWVQENDSNLSDLGSRLDNAIKLYFSVLKLFSVVTEYEHLTEGEAWKLTHGFKAFGIDDEESLNNLAQSISPIGGGSASGFLMFFDMFDDMIYMLRKLLKHTGASSHSFLAGPESSDVMITDPATHKASLSDDIEKDHWFPQTIRAPMYGKSGYSYMYTNAQGSSAYFEQLGVAGTNGGFHVSAADFDDMIDTECAKFFTDTSAALPPVGMWQGGVMPLDFNQGAVFGFTDDTKHTYITLKGVWLNGSYVDLDITSNVTEMEWSIDSSLDLKKVNYANTLLQILTRAELDRGAHPQVFSGPLAEDDSSLSLQDQILLSKLMLGRSCLINPQEALSSEWELDKYQELFITDYDQVPADELEEFSDVYYGYFSPSKNPPAGGQPSDYTLYGTEKLSFYVFLLMQLAVHDEYGFFGNLDFTKYRVTNNPMANLNSADYLTKLVSARSMTSAGGMSAPPTQEGITEILRKLPNPIKYLFETINRKGSDLDAILSSLADVNIRSWLYSNVISPYFFGQDGAGSSPNVKEIYAALYFNFFTIAKIEVFVGYEIMEDGTCSVKHPIWKLLRAYQSSTAAAAAGLPEEYDHIKGTNKKILCRFVEWDGGETLSLNKKYSSMPIIGKYFFLKGL